MDSTCTEQRPFGLAQRGKTITRERAWLTLAPSSRGVGKMAKSPGYFPGNRGVNALTRGQGTAGSWGVGWEGWWEEIETQMCETPAPPPGATPGGGGGIPQCPATTCLV